MINLTTHEIFKDISEYQFNKDNVLDFILDDHRDISTFYYFRNMLFNLLELNSSFNNLICFYYKLELGSVFSKNIEIVQDGVLKKCKCINLLEKEKEKEKVILDRFISGDTDILRDILKFFQELITDINYLDHDIALNSDMLELLEQIDSLEWSIYSKEDIIDRFTKKMLQEEQKITSNEPIVIEKKEENSNITKITRYKHFKRLHYNKYKKMMMVKIKDIEKEIKELSVEKNSLLQELHTLCEEKDLGKVWDVLYDHYQFYNKKIKIKSVFNELKRTINSYNTFINDVYSSSRVIQSYFDFLNRLDDDLDLLDICTIIRTNFKNNHLPTNNESENEWTVGLKTTDNKSFTKTTRVDELDEVMSEMNERFKMIMKMDTNYDFIRACADFHFDMLKIHPFSDGNGRTSRTLLTLMLASKNILVPSLYTTYDQKEEFYIKSNKALEGNYGVIEKELLDRLVHFNPLIIPEEEMNEEKRTMTR